MNWWWLAASIVVWLFSASCIISTVVELGTSKAKKKAEFWGVVAFHGVTAILALWFLLLALG